MYISSSYPRIALLASYANRTVQQSCLTFYYYMRGSANNTLKVYANITTSHGYNAQLLWQNTGDLEDLWHRAKIDVSAGQASMVFEGMVFYGTVALDDVLHQLGACDDVAQGLTPVPGELLEKYYCYRVYR